MRRYIGDKNTLYKSVNHKKKLLIRNMSDRYINPDILSVINALNNENIDEINKLIGELKKNPHTSSKLNFFIKAMEKVVGFITSNEELCVLLHNHDHPYSTSGIIECYSIINIL